MVSVVFTRTTDVFLELNERVRLTNASGCDLFVSFHENAASPSASGYEDFRHTVTGAATIKAHQAFHGVIKPFLVANGIKNRGMKTANYAVLRCKAPALLIENLFISNAGDLAKQTDKAFMAKFAKVYANGIKAALVSLGKPNGKVMLDAGHGGKDPGAVNGSHKEKDHVLALVKMVAAELKGTATKPATPTPTTPAKGNLGESIVAGATKFHLQSGTFPTKAMAQATLDTLIAKKLLWWGKVQQGKDGLFRYVSGEYKSKAEAKAAVDKIFASTVPSTRWFTIVGTK